MPLKWLRWYGGRPRAKDAVSVLRAVPGDKGGGKPLLKARMKRGKLPSAREESDSGAYGKIQSKNQRTLRPASSSLFIRKISGNRIPTPTATAIPMLSH